MSWRWLTIIFVIADDKPKTKLQRGQEAKLPPGVVFIWRIGKQCKVVHELHEDENIWEQ